MKKSFVRTFEENEMPQHSISNRTIYPLFLNRRWHPEAGQRTPATRGTQEYQEIPAPSVLSLKDVTRTEFLLSYMNGASDIAAAGNRRGTR
jgi:hypothetical protein